MINIQTKVIVYFLLISTIVFAGQLNATTYYVDATGGNDNNSGTNITSAWKTIDRVIDETFLPGDNILFKRGEVWTGEQLEIAGYSGTETGLITFGAYSDTALPNPVITTITEHSHTWTNQGGNLWKANNPPDYHPERLWVDGTELLRANNMTELDGIDFLWLYDAEENGDFYLYSDTNPSTKQIKYTNERMPLYLEDANYIAFINLDLQGAWASVYLNCNVSHIHFDEMKIGKFASSGININSETDSKPNHIHILNSDFDAGFTLDYSMAEFFPGTDDRGVGDAIFVQCAENCEINNCYFKNWGHASINIDGNPFGAGDVKVSYISVHDNYATSPDICYGGRMAIDDAHHCELFNNRIINTSIQCQFNGFNNHVHHNIIDGTRNTPILDNAVEISAGFDICGYSNTEVFNNIYENNLIKNIEGVGIQISTCGDYNIHDNIIRNNIIFNCGTVEEVEGIGILVEENTNDCQTYDNTFHNNLVFNESTANTIKFRNLITDIPGFNALQGISGYQIADNIAGDPLFVDINISDFHLLCSSPCIDAGTEALSAFDFDGNSIPFDGTETDIGIYEYQHNILQLDLKVFLEGPFNGTNMNTDLTDIPLSQPYNITPWNYEGTESVDTIPADVMDWVLIELRDTTDASLATGETVIARQAAFLLNDGAVVGMDGSSILAFNHSIIHSLFVVIHHRNHLPVMSANPVTKTNGIYSYDFTDATEKAYGGNQVDLGNGVYGMYAADINADGVVNETDINLWKQIAGKKGYLKEDANLDTQVDNKDKNDLFVPNEGESSLIPE